MNPLDQIAGLIARTDFGARTKLAGLALVLLEERHPGLPHLPETVGAVCGLDLPDTLLALHCLRVEGLVVSQPVYREGEPDPDPVDRVYRWTGPRIGTDAEGGGG